MLIPDKKIEQKVIDYLTLKHYQFFNIRELMTELRLTDVSQVKRVLKTLVRTNKVNVIIDPEDNKTLLFQINQVLKEGK